VFHAWRRYTTDDLDSVNSSKPAACAVPPPFRNGFQERHHARRDAGARGRPVAAALSAPIAFVRLAAGARAGRPAAVAVSLAAAGVLPFRSGLGLPQRSMGAR